MRITLNLATNPALRARRLLGLAAGLLASVAVGLTLWVGVQGWHSWREGANPRARSAELRLRLSQLEGRQQEYETRLRAPAARAVLERATFYNQLLQRKAVSWAQLFIALEQHLPDRVRILAVTPELAEDGGLRLELRVGAESATALVQFLKDLEQGPGFTAVAVRSHERSARGGEDPVVANVTALYRGGG